MRVRVRAATILIATAMCAGAAAQAQEQGAADRWQFTITPYLWLPSVSASVNGLPGSDPPTVERTSADVLSSLQAGAMLAGEIRYGRWSLLGDFIYARVSSDLGTSAPPATSTNVRTEGSVGSAALSFTALQDQRVRFDLLAGARYYHIALRTRLYFRSTLLTDSTSSNGWVDPIVGARIRVRLSEHWFSAFYGDVGGFGAGSEFSGQAIGTIGYSFGFGDVMAGWRHLHIERRRGSFVFEGDLTGPILGMAFRW